MAPVCVRAEASSLARVCWQRVEHRQSRASREFCFFVLFVVVWWRAVVGVCALLGAVCAAGCCVRGSTPCVRLALCVCRALLSIFCCVIVARHDTDVLFLCRTNCRLLLARRCFGSNVERGRRCSVEPNVDWSRLLAVVGLQDSGFQLQQHCYCSVQRQWFSDVLVRPARAFALSLCARVRALMTAVCAL